MRTVLLAAAGMPRQLFFGGLEGGKEVFHLLVEEGEVAVVGFCEADALTVAGVALGVPFFLPSFVVVGEGVSEPLHGPEVFELVKDVFYEEVEQFLCRHSDFAQESLDVGNIFALCNVFFHLIHHNLVQPTANSLDGGESLGVVVRIFAGCGDAVEVAFEELVRFDDLLQLGDVGKHGHYVQVLSIEYEVFAEGGAEGGAENGSSPLAP